jgi:hypothetical protein
VFASRHSNDTATLVGEACHIRDARPKTKRYDPNQNDEQRSSIRNTIWLCANCHSEIDKNDGNKFSVQFLTHVKKKHEDEINQSISENIMIDIDVSGVGETIGIETSSNSVSRIDANVRVFGIGRTVGMKIG